MDSGQRVPRSRRVTISDIAAATGVAPSTVSRALTRPGRVSRLTRERIEAAARELNYVATRQAPAVPAPGHTETVALLISDVTNPYYFGLIRGAQRQLQAAGYAQLVIDTEESERTDTEILHRLRATIDGAILAATRLAERALTGLAAEVPIVALNRAVRGVPSVVIDTPASVAQAVEHLVSLGHRDIAYLSGPDGSWANRARWHALLTATARYRLRPRRLGPFPAARLAGPAAADALLTTGATACIAFNDLLAIGVLGRLSERGVGVPEEVSVVGCDDIFGADFCAPPLTTLTAPIERAGRLAAAMLLARLTDGPAGEARSVVLPTHLTVRASTGPVRKPRPTPTPTPTPTPI